MKEEEEERRRRVEEEERRECEILTAFSELLNDSLLLISQLKAGYLHPSQPSKMNT